MEYVNICILSLRDVGESGGYRHFDEAGPHVNEEIPEVLSLNLFDSNWQCGWYTFRLAMKWKLSPLYHHFRRSYLAAYRSAYDERRKVNTLRSTYLLSRILLRWNRKPTPTLILFYFTPSFISTGINNRLNNGSIEFFLPLPVRLFSV